MWLRLQELVSRLGVSLVLLVGLGLVISALILSRLSVRTTFQVDAETEIASGVTASRAAYPSTHIVWPLEGASLCAGLIDPLSADPDCAGTIRLDDFGGLLEIRSQAALEVERIASGPLALSLAAEDAEREPLQVYLTLDTELPADSPFDPDEALPEPIILRIDQPQRLAAIGRPVSLPFLAERITFGREASSSGLVPQAMLRSGVVSILGWDLFRPFLRRGQIYLARTVDLRYGDEVMVVPQKANHGDNKPANGQGKASVLLRVDERPGLQAVLQTNGREVSIRGFFSEARVESLTFLDKILHDPVLTVAWSILGLVLGTVIGLLGLSVAPSPPPSIAPSTAPSTGPEPVPKPEPATDVSPAREGASKPQEEPDPLPDEVPR